MLIINFLELLGVSCGIFISLLLFPWISVIFFKKPTEIVIEQEVKIEQKQEEEYSYIIFLEGNNTNSNPRISEKLKQELELRGISGKGRISELKEKIDIFDKEIHIKAIRSAYSNKSFKDVISKVNQRLKLHPKNKELCVFLIRSYFAQKNYYQCIDICEDLLELDENNIVALRFIARSYNNLKIDEKALESYLFISELFEDDLDSRLMLMRYYFNENQYENTILICEEILSIDEGNINAEKFIAESNLILGNKERSLKKYLEIIEKQPENIDSIHSLVKFYFNEKNFEECIKWCEEVLFLDKNNIRAWKTISRCHIKMETMHNSIESMLKVIELNPSELETYIILIRYYYTEKDYENCINICNKLLEQDGTNLDAMRFKARSNENLGNEEVIEEYLEIAVLNNSDIDSRMKIMKYYYRKKEFQNCIDICNEIIEIVGERNDILNMLSRSYFNLGNYKLAKENILKLLKSEPENLKYLLIAIRASFNVKEYEDSMKYSKQYLSINDSDLIVKRILARSYHYLGNNKLAEEILFELISKNPKDLESRITLIRNNYSSGNFEKVHELCDEILEKRKNNRIALLFHARAFTATKEFEKALNAWEYVLGKFKNDPEALSGAGRICYNHGKTELARDYLERALKKSPDSYQIKRSLSLVYIRQKEWDLALPILESECKRKPLEFINWERRINLLHDMSRRDEALNCLNDIFEFIPNEKDAHFMAYIISKSYFWLEEANHHKKCAEIYFQEDNTINLVIKFLEYFIDNGDLTQALYYLDLGFKKDNLNEQLLEINSNYDNLLKLIDTPRSYIEKALKEDKTVLLSECIIKSIFEKSKTFINHNWSKNKKLAMISSSLNRGGAERQVVSCLEGLSKSNNFKETKLFCYAIDNSGGSQETYGEEVKKFNIPIVEFGKIKNWTEGFTNADELLKPWKDLLQHLSTRMRREIEPMFLTFRTYEPSIVHTWQDTTNICTGLAAAMAGVPKVLMFGRSLRPDGKSILHMRNKPYLKEAYNTLLKSENFTLCLNSEAGAKSYSEWLEIPVDEIKVLHNGTDFSGIDNVCAGKNITQELKEFGINENDKVVGTVFRFVIEKRPLLWIKTAQKILSKSPNIHFVLIGSGGLFDTVKLEIENNKLADRIHLVGQTNLIKLWLDRMDLFLMTSKVEGLPNVLIEAQGFGVPVISTNAGGANETFIEGITGKLVNDSKAESLAENVIEKLFDEEWLENASKKSIENAREKFDKNSMFKKLCNMYDNL